MRKVLRNVAKSALDAVGLSIRHNPPWATKAGSYSLWKSEWGERNRDDYVQLFGQDAVDNRRFYNIGAGGFRHPAWTNVDKRSDWYAGNKDNVDIDCDLLDLVPLSLEDNSARAIYSSHVIEHIPNDCAANLFAEAYRAMAPGGVLRITCPDAAVNHAAYARGDRVFFHYLYDNIQACFLHTFAAQLLKADYEESLSPAEVGELFSTLPLDDALDAVVSRCSVEYQRTRPGNHMNWWHLDKLERFLKEAGFKECHRSGYGQSICPVLRDTQFFDNTVPRFSLYLDAVK
jgi:predicted SAM-dependent methyltransferase